MLINQGATGVWARAEGAILTIQSRAMGTAGNGITISADTLSDVFGGSRSADRWRAELTASGGPTWRRCRGLNRAARDWHTSFFRALKGYGIDVTAAFSMELQHGDPSPEAGIAQRYPDGSPVLLNTPALQTNFSPVSLAFWRQVYLDMANLLAQSGRNRFCNSARCSGGISRCRVSG